jgi:hypothetical protein
MLTSELNSTELAILSLFGTGDGTAGNLKAYQGDDYENRIGFTRHLLRDMGTRHLQLLLDMLNDDRFFWGYEQLRYMNPTQLMLLLSKYSAQRHGGGALELSRYDGLHYFADGNFLQNRKAGSEDSYYSYFPDDTVTLAKGKRELLFLDERPFLSAPADAQSTVPGAPAHPDGDDAGFDYYSKEKLATHRMWHTNLLTNYPQSIGDVTVTVAGTSWTASDGG